MHNVKEYNILLESQDKFLLLKAIRRAIDEYHQQGLHEEIERLYNLKQQIESMN